jgi:hypothetical protein
MDAQSKHQHVMQGFIIYILSERKSSGRVAELTRPNPKMKRVLSVLPVYWKVEETHEDTRV